MLTSIKCRECSRFIMCARRSTQIHIRALLVLVIAGSIAVMPTHIRAETKEVRFGVQPWPGVTVKTEVVTQILESLGYETSTQQLNTPVIIQGLSTGDLDVNLGIWYPLFKSTVDPKVEAGKIVLLSKNLSGALSSVAVPRYVHEAGVESVEDLARYADRFDRKIYGIEAGAEWNEAVKQAIKEDRYGLSGWKVVPSGTAGMLAQVGRAIKNGEWIAFDGWKPHWMNAVYDLYYLDVPEGSQPEDSQFAQVRDDVYTVVSAGFSNKNPNLGRFFRQFEVTAETQSQWIYEHSYKEVSESNVARTWISENMDRVREWTDGVKTAEGRSAVKAVEAANAGSGD